MNAVELINSIRDTSLSNKERGDALEDYTFDIIDNEPGIDVKKTKASGAIHGDGDILAGKDLCLDGKVHGQCKNISINKTEIEKIRHQAAKLDRVGAIVTPIIKNDTDVDIYITMKLEEFLECIQSFTGDMLT